MVPWQGVKFLQDWQLQNSPGIPQLLYLYLPFYLLLDTAMGKASYVADMLRARPGVCFADMVTGPHNVIALLDGPDSKTGTYRALADIQNLEGVEYVTLCVTVRERGSTPHQAE